VGGRRVKKNSVRLEAYGTVDELSSAIGAIISDVRVNNEVKGQLLIVQNELFNIGSYLATLPEEDTKPKCVALTDKKMADLEGWIDALDEQTPKQKSFVLPSGCEIASKAHMARVICRRAERRILDLADESYVDPDVISYINRLSDYLFAAARYFNFIQGIDEIAWKP